MTTSLMTSEEKFIRLINKFDCAVAQLKHRGIAPSYDPTNWGLTVDANKAFAIFPTESRIHPLAIVLEGIKVSEKIYGKRPYKSYQGYCSGYYPYLELQRIFQLRNVLQEAFREGYQNAPGNRNLYIEDYREQPEYAMAFEVGRYLINKHFGTKLKCAKLPLFEKI